eukprot:gene9749-1952_t
MSSPLTHLFPTIILEHLTPYDPRAAVPIFGLVGVINLVEGPCLICIDRVRSVGAIHGKHIVLQITSVRLQPFSTNMEHLSTTETTSQEHCMDLLTYLFASGDFYFSMTYDLTSSVQQQSIMWQNRTGLMDELADPRFYWNRALHKPFVGKAELRRLAIPIIMGFIHIEALNVNGKACQYCLISRRATARAGTRFYKRGIDVKGHVANYIETEQLPNLKYTPPVYISLSQDHLQAARRHFNDLTMRYGEVLALNLAGKTKMEGDLGDRYEAIIDRLMTEFTLKYLHFDFHTECSRFRWDRLNKLLELMQNDRVLHGFCVLDQSKVEQHFNGALRHQMGIIRTNCIDCLDRTNVVQSMIAKQVLIDQFTFLGLVDKSVKDIEKVVPVFARRFRVIWADHADQCSRQYAASSALKSDFTRTGKRSIHGMLQDAIDILVGIIDLLDIDYINVLASGNYLHRRKESPLHLKLAPLTLLCAVSMALVSAIVPIVSIPFQLAFIFAWIALAFAAIGVILRSPFQFVCLPSVFEDDFGMHATRVSDFTQPNFLPPPILESVLVDSLTTKKV